MEIDFGTLRLKKLFESEKELVRKYGTKEANALIVCLTYLEGSEKLDDVSTLPPTSLHSLDGDRKGQFAVGHKKRKNRIVFVPDHNPLPTLNDKELDKKKVTKIKILEVKDYH
jgi:proteic killer suppression protein